MFTSEQARAISGCRMEGESFDHAEDMGTFTEPAAADGITEQQRLAQLSMQFQNVRRKQPILTLNICF